MTCLAFDGDPSCRRLAFIFLSRIALVDFGTRDKGSFPVSRVRSELTGAGFGSGRSPGPPTVTRQVKFQLF